MQRYQEHIATFKGKHNMNKAKILLYLYAKKMRGDPSGRSAREIYLATGVPYNYLKSRLGVLTDWGYLDRRAIGRKKGRAIYHYRIAERGVRFVELRLPPEKYNQAVQEINEWQKQRFPPYKLPVSAN